MKTRDITQDGCLENSSYLEGEVRAPVSDRQCWSIPQDYRSISYTRQGERMQLPLECKKHTKQKYEKVGVKTCLRVCRR